MRVSGSLKECRSPDWSLQLDSMKSESLVIANQSVAVNTFPGACTHRPVTPWEWDTKEVDWFNLRENDYHFVFHDWGEVVTR